MEISYPRLKQWTLSYAALPLFIFLCGWLKPYIGLPLAALLGYALYCSVFQGVISKPITSNFKLLTIVVLVAIIWCYFAGLGGFYYQSNDHHWRNAIFRDLINYDWPVRYRSLDSALVYYIGFWLPAAFVAKVGLWLGASAEAAFIIGNMALLVYSIIGIALLALNLIYALSANTKGKVLFTLLLLVFFSGMDILGAMFRTEMVGFHLEWWANFFQFSSLSTDLFWVYNQAIIAWLVVMVFYNEQQENDFAFLALLCLFSSPLPAIGLAIYMIIIAVQDFFAAVDGDRIKAFIKQVFSAQNIIATFVLLPVAGAYLTSNATVEGNGLRLIFSQFWPLQLLFLPIFWLLEFAIFALLIAPHYTNNRLFKITVWSLLLIPLFIFGPIADFSMRVSIPALLLLMVMCAKFLLENPKTIRGYLLIAALLIGAVTPATEFYRGFKAVISADKLMLRADNVKSFEGKITPIPGSTFVENSNFGTFSAENYFFYKYLAKAKN